ncbi:Uncharacterized protein BM_BM8753 [Brugia malayi]|uniref:Bm8753 n=3 Tax=Brugia TaxID=6278 RepID=A0A4E9FL54_BRUMA|nr:Uncharacterized protein BM_BM8753 [Brugia malayi]VIO97232.1 Uncharacterized protein BM_BM8753 [Brugia malayi]
MLQEKEERKVDDAIHDLHVLYMKYFSLVDPWQPSLNRTNQRTQLLQRMATAVDEILNANKRPNWLHPAMFHGPLTSAICSLPPIPDSNAILMPPIVDPREVYWSKFSICNHSRPLEQKPFIVSLQYYSPHSLQKLPNNFNFSSSSSTSPLISDSLTISVKKNALPRVGALPNDKFRDAKQIEIELFVGKILRARGLQFNRTNDESIPKKYLYQLPSTNPTYE